MLAGFRVLADAERELDYVVEWYESERPGLGLEFLDAYDSTIEYALGFPEAGIPWPSQTRRRDIRSFRISRFPYTVIATTIDNTFIVVAIAHDKRRPGYWRIRLAKNAP